MEDSALLSNSKDQSIPDAKMQSSVHYTTIIMYHKASKATLLCLALSFCF